MNKRQQLEQFFTDVQYASGYWFFGSGATRYRILDYTLSNILRTDLTKNSLKDYLIRYSLKV